MDQKEVSKLPLNHILSLIQQGKVVFFVGAGISVPSNLPTGKQLTIQYARAAISRLAFTKHFGKEILQQIDKGHMGARLEVILQCFYEEISSSTFEPLEFFVMARPNPYHYFLAECLRFGNTIITTNFDSLIEDACQNRAVNYFPVISEADFAGLRDVKHQRLKRLIVKIHGSLRGKHGDDTRQTIIASLAQVASGIHPLKAELLNRLLKEFHLLCLGYSGLDDFDIYPKLQITRTPKSIYWFDYRSIHPSFNTKDKITTQQHKDHIDKLILDRPFGLRIIGDTNQIVRTLWKELGCGRYPSTKPKSVSWEASFKGWSKKHLVNGGGSKRLIIIGKMLEGLGQISQARACYERALYLTNVPHDQVRILLLLGWVHERLSLYGEAKICFNQAKDIALQMNDISSLTSAYRGLGRTDMRGDNFAQAILHYTAGLKLAKRKKDDLEISRLYNSLGNVYWMMGRWNQAKRCYQEGIKRVKKSLGENYLTYCRLNHNLALVFWKMRKLAIANWYTQKALHGYEKIGYAAGLAGCYTTLGSIAKLKGNISKAFEYQKLNHDIWKSIGNKDEVAMSLNNLGILYLYKSEFRNAEVCHLEALRFFRKERFCHPLAQTFSYLGSLYKEQKHLCLAEKHYLATIKYAERAQADEILADAYVSLADVLVTKRHFTEAKTYLEKAERVLSTIRDHLGLAIAFRVHGRLEAFQGKINFAHYYLNKSSKELRHSPDLVEKGRLSLTKAEIFKERGDYIRSKQWLVKAKLFFRKAGFLPELNITSEMLVERLLRVRPVRGGRRSQD